MGSAASDRCVSSIKFLFIYLMGWDWVHLVRRPLSGLLYQPWIIGDDECGAVGGMTIGMENRSTRRKPTPVPSAPLSTTNPTWPDLGSNSGRRGAKLPTNRLSYGTASHLSITCMPLNFSHSCELFLRSFRYRRQSLDSSVDIATGWTAAVEFPTGAR
jgi:hypothetical protein